MELEIQQCEKTKAVREEQLERLTQICQEQAVSSSCVANSCGAVALQVCNAQNGATAEEKETKPGPISLDICWLITGSNKTVLLAF